MMPGLLEIPSTIEEILDEIGVGRGTVPRVRKELIKRGFSKRIVESAEIHDSIDQAVRSYLEQDSSEDDAPEPESLRRGPSPRSSAPRSLSIRTSNSEFSASSRQREGSSSSFGSVEKDPERPEIEEGSIWFSSEDRAAVTCCFCLGNVNYVGDHVLGYGKSKDLTEDIEKGKIILQFRKDKETRSNLVEFEIKPDFEYDILLSGNWKEHNVQREKPTTTKSTSVSKSNEGRKRGFKQDREKSTVASHRNENSEEAMGGAYRKSRTTKQTIRQSSEDPSIIMNKPSSPGGNQGQMPRGDLPMPGSPQIFMTPEQLVDLIKASNSKGVKDKWSGRSHMNRRSNFNPRRSHSDSDESLADRDKDDVLFDKETTASSVESDVSAITNPDSGSPIEAPPEDALALRAKAGTAEPPVFTDYGW